MPMTNAKRLLTNTLLLTAAAFLMKTVAVGFNVYLTNKIGADGIGLFQLISAVYGMAVTFSVAGIRLASMRLVADNIALGMRNERQIMRRCLVYSFVCGCVVAALLAGFSDLIGSRWIGDMRSVPSLKVLGLSLPFVAMSAALNGYFTSVKKIVRYTAVQLAEQIFKIIITVFMLKAALTHGLEASCAAIVFGISSAEFFSLCCSYTLYRLSLCRDEKGEKGSELWKRILRISLPDAVGSEMRSVLMTVEHLLIPIGLRKSGSDPQTSLAAYGVIHGMSLPLVLYPSALLSSLSGLLVPEISARVLHLTLIFSIGTAGIMYFNAKRLSLAVYGNDSAFFYIRILSPLIPVMYCDMSVDGMLKGLDQQVSYMRYNIIDASICVVLVYLLVPVFSVSGYIIVVFVSEIINLALSFGRLTKVSDVNILFFKDIFIPLLCVIGANLLKNLIFASFDTASFKLAASLEITTASAIYLALIIIFGSIDKEELRWLRSLAA